MVSDMTRVYLGDVAREVKQKAPVGQGLPTVGLEHLNPGEVELARWDESSETTFTKAFSKGQVLFGTGAIRASQGLPAQSGRRSIRRNLLRRHHRYRRQEQPLSEAAPLHHPDRCPV